MNKREGPSGKEEIALGDMGCYGASGAEIAGVGKSGF